MYTRENKSQEAIIFLFFLPGKEEMEISKSSSDLHRRDVDLGNIKSWRIEETKEKIRDVSIVNNCLLKWI